MNLIWDWFIISDRSMEPEQLCPIVKSITNRRETILWYLQRCKKSHVENDCFLEVRLLWDGIRIHSRLSVAFTEQLQEACCFWAQEMSTACWDRIIMRVWDAEQWLQSSQMHNAMFLDLCAEPAPALTTQGH